MLEAAQVIADKYFGYKKQVENPAFKAWEDKEQTMIADETITSDQMSTWRDENPEPPKSIDNTEERSYMINIEGRVAHMSFDKYSASYYGQGKFEGNVRAWIPPSRNGDDW
jgi:hypothetical protein